MGTTMHVILGLLMAVLGSLSFGVSGLLIGGVVGILAAEVLGLRKRIAVLEKAEKAGGAVRPEKKVEPAAEVIFSQVVAPPKREKVFSAETEKTPITEQQSPIDRFFGGLGTGVNDLAAKIGGFFTSGNLVLKIGVVILFFGVAFLLKYAAQRNMVPVEMRLAGVALGG